MAGLAPELLMGFTSEMAVQILVDHKTVPGGLRSNGPIAVSSTLPPSAASSSALTLLRDEFDQGQRTRKTFASMLAHDNLTPMGEILDNVQ